MSKQSQKHNPSVGASPPPKATQEEELRLVLAAMDALIAQLAPLLYGDYESSSDEMPDTMRKWEIEVVFRKIHKLWPIWRRLSETQQVDQQIVSELDRDLNALSELWDNAEEPIH